MVYVVKPLRAFDLAREQVWFHATTVQDWLTTVMSQPRRPFVHVGTRHAALERASQFSRLGPRLQQTHDLYRLYISRGAEVYPYVLKDIDNWQDDVDENGPQVYAYYNEYEHSGSVSLMLDPIVLSLVGKQTLPKGLLVQRRIV